MQNNGWTHWLAVVNTLFTSLGALTGIAALIILIYLEFIH